MSSHAHAPDHAAGTPRRISVVHSTAVWLPLTETWIARQLASLPADVDWSVVCDRRTNVDVFPQEGVAAVADRGRLAMTWARALRRTGIRRHVGLLATQVSRLRPDILHSHFGDIAWQNRRFAIRRGLPHVVSVYGSDVTMLPATAPVWRRRYADLFQSARLVLCEGPHMAATVIALGCPPERARVHRLGVDVAGIPFRPRRWRRGEALRVLCVASFTQKKGIPDGIRALGRLVEDGVDIRLTLVGGARGEAGRREAERITDALAETGLGDRVRMPGYLPSAAVAAEAEEAHVFMAPSRIADDGDAEGGAPVALVEMAAAGLPILATRHCDIPNMLAQPNRDLLTPEGDPRALADALRRLLESDWAVIARANRDFIAREADCVAQGRRLGEIYREMVTA